jgi:hypothetical protein
MALEENGISNRQLSSIFNPPLAVFDASRKKCHFFLVEMVEDSLNKTAAAEIQV